MVIGDKVGGRRILAGYGEGPFARMRIGAVLHPAVHRIPGWRAPRSALRIAHPRSVRIDESPLLHRQHVRLLLRNESSLLHSFRAAFAGQGFRIAGSMAFFTCGSYWGRASLRFRVGSRRRCAVFSPSAPYRNESTG